MYYEVKITKSDDIKILVSSDKFVTHEDVEASIVNGFRDGSLTVESLSTVSSWDNVVIAMIDAHILDSSVADSVKDKRTVIKLISKEESDELLSTKDGSDNKQSEE